MLNNLLGVQLPLLRQSLPYFNIQISLHARFPLLKLGSTIVEW